MTPASCAPEETAARFQNSSPPAAPRGGDRPPLSRAPPGPQFGSPSSALPPCTPRLLLDTSQRFQSNSLGWHRAGTRDKKHGAATTREQAEPRASAPPPTRALLAGTPGARRTAPRTREAPPPRLLPPRPGLGGSGANLPGRSAAGTRDLGSRGPGGGKGTSPPEAPSSPGRSCGDPHE